jgi:hypothetical protein
MQQQAAIDKHQAVLVASGGDLSDETSGWSRVQVLPAFRSGQSKPAGQLLREATAAGLFDLVAVARVPARLSYGWLEAAAGALDRSAGAVILTAADTPLLGSPCPVGAATVFRGSILREMGGFLPAFDLAGTVLDALWRVQARGYDVVALNGLVQEGTVVESPPLDLLLALAASNLEVDNLRGLLPSIVMAAVTNPLHAAGVDTTALDLRQSPGGDEVPTLPVPAGALDGVWQVDAFTNAVPRVERCRAIAQATRRLSDRYLADRISVLIDGLWERVNGDRAFLEQALGGAFDAAPTMHGLVVVEGDDRSGIQTADRAVTALGGTMRLRLLDLSDYTWRDWDGSAWGDPSPAGDRDIEEWPDLVLLSGAQIRKVPWLLRTQQPVLIDATHWAFEADLASEFPRLAPPGPGSGAEVLTETFARADHILVRDAEQRDVALGIMAGLSRLKPNVYDEDNSLNNLVAVVEADPVASLGWCRRPRRALDLVQSFNHETLAAEVKGSLLSFGRNK